MTVGAAATLDLGGHDITVTGLAGAGAVSLGGNTLTSSVPAGAFSFSGVTSGTGGFIKTGGGVQMLSGCGGAYTGVTRIDGGALAVSCLRNGGQPSSIGAAPAAAGNLVISNGATLRYAGPGDVTDRLFTLAAGVTTIESSGAGPVVFANPGAAALAGDGQARTFILGGANTGANTLAAVIGDAGAGVTTLTKTGGGTWILTGNKPTPAPPTSMRACCSLAAAASPARSQAPRSTTPASLASTAATA